MSRSDSALPRDTAPSPLLARDGEPVFSEAWQAQTLALAATLVEAGVFSAVQWSDGLGAELRAAQADGQADGHETYYAAALAALEQLLAAQDAIPTATLEARTEAWRRAYRNTPHGAPVELATGL